MRKLDFRVNYPVTLLSYVDSLSKWDQFVDKYIRNKFDSLYTINLEDEKYLNTYSTLRKKFGWDRETDLLNWAHAGFSDNAEFDTFINVFKYFEKRKNKKGKTLKSELEKATKQLKEVLPEVQDRFESLEIEDTVMKFVDLFGTPTQKGILPCYLTYSPDKEATQGGANGEGIYTEVSTSLPKESQSKVAVEVIAHEYMHKEIHPGNYFKNLPEKKAKKIYHKIFSHLYPDALHLFAEEVIIYALSDVLIFGTNAMEMKDHYTKKGDTRLAFLWQSVEGVKPILKGYGNKTKQREETLKKLDMYFQGLV